MLEIKNIVKDYKTGADTVHALRGVSIAFRDSELVAVLGHSGCGKTTLLNIIGGLDRYTSGDLIIDGRSTKEYKDRDWDTYRNHSIGFIFQSYNLIPHQSVLSNVELALTLSGVSKSERRRRAKEALEKVGLGDQLHKRPNQMSGGQMQRVAIARALVNDPEILLADEPTGALDSETSLQIMALIKEIAKDRLVIMVTHNPDLANDYATRIVRLVDGEITSDSKPFDPSAEKSEKEKKSKSKSSRKSKMSFLTALSLSRNNLMTKKARTFLTAFAGSIGIIGISLILSLSNGVQTYIDSVERSTLASYPIQIDKQTVNYSELMSSMMDMGGDEDENRDPNRVYVNDMSTNMTKVMLSEVKKNDLPAFLETIKADSAVMENINEIHYTYNNSMYVFGRDVNDEIIQVNPSTVMSSAWGGDASNSIGSMTTAASTFMGTDVMARMNVFQELLSNDMIKDSYDVLTGKLPESYDEVVIMINDRNEVSNLTLYTLGLLDQKELTEMIEHVMAGEEWEGGTSIESLSYDELLGLKLTMLTAPELYQKNDKGGYDNMSEDQDYMENALKNGTELKVVGVIKPNSDSLLNSSTMGGIGYTSALTEYMINKTNDSELVKLQKDNPDTDIFTGIAFPKKDDKPQEPMTQEEALQKVMEFMSQEQIAQMFQAVVQTLTPEQQAELIQLPQEQQFAKAMALAEPNKVTGALMSVLTAQQMQQLQEMMKEPETTEATYEKNMEKLGEADLAKPDSIMIYAKDFDAKETISQFISDYNKRMTDADKEDDVIEYTDYVGMMISSVSDIVNAISYILIAFVAISLVVSSIMIGIITYISVLERTKEIGILRAIGASKGNISNVFNAETLMVGFVAGAIGILVTVLLNIPITAIIHRLTGINTISSTLPPVAGVALVIISMLLTLIAGLFPASIAAKKDPVIALRTE